MLKLLKERLFEVLKAVAPLLMIAIVLDVVLVGGSTEALVRFLAGAVLTSAGMLLLFIGIDVGIVPMGRYIGAELPRRHSPSLILAVTFGLGLVTTAAEPDVLVLADQVYALSSGAIGGTSLVYVIATGVGLFAAIAMLRTLRGFSMTRLLASVYVLVIVLSLAAPTRFVPLAHDAGSVTTGVLTAPVVIALTLGVTSVLGARSTVADGFGFLGLASAGPIILLLLMGLASA